MNDEMGNSGWAMEDYSDKSESIEKEKLPGKATEFRWLFWAEIVIVVAAAGYFLSPVIRSIGFNVAMLAASFVASLVYVVFTLKLGRLGESFRMAGLFFLAYSVLNFLSENLKVNATVIIAISIAAVVCMIVYVIKFCDSCRELLRESDLRLATSWDSYKTIILFLYALLVICSLAEFLPIILLIAHIAYNAVTLAFVAMYFWHLYLLHKTDASLRVNNPA